MGGSKQHLGRGARSNRIIVESITWLAEVRETVSVCVCVFIDICIPSCRQPLRCSILFFRVQCFVIQDPIGFCEVLRLYARQRSRQRHEEYML